MKPRLFHSHGNRVLRLGGHGIGLAVLALTAAKAHAAAHSEVAEGVTHARVTRDTDEPAA